MKLIFTITLCVFNLAAIEENVDALQGNVDVINVDNGNLEPENVNDCKIPEKNYFLYF